MACVLAGLKLSKIWALHPQIHQARSLGDEMTISLIGYTTLGTNDLARGTAFYDDLLATIGIERLWAHGNMVAWGTSRNDPAFCIAKPFDGELASAGNGTMIALRVHDRASVDRLHSRALELGGSDEGKPGPRGDHGFYGAYFRDLDGNKLNAYVPAS